MLPDAPARFSMITLCPNARPQASEIRRAAISTLPPGAKGTISVIARSGKASAAVAGAVQQAATARAAHKAPATGLMVMRMSPRLAAWWRSGTAAL
ncbi:hypothetical protein D3C87_1609130 [compost metagenome]